MDASTWRCLEPREWERAAACMKWDPDLFFPAGTVGPAVALQVEAAKAVCAGCPVRVPCLRRALATGEAGVWGGTTDAERVVLRRRERQRAQRAARRAA